MRILNPIIVILLLFCFGGLSLFMMLVGLNGFSESTGGLILLSSAIAALLISIGTSAASFYAARRLESVLSWNAFIIHALCVIAFSLLGIVLVLFSYFAILLFFTEILGKK